ncbi:hypothetical protein BG000_009016 [Podila horticola]|nr:hypothetical protein BG000_009016 [Podila horticola]
MTTQMHHPFAPAGGSSRAGGSGSGRSHLPRTHSSSSSTSSSANPNNHGHRSRLLPMDPSLSMTDMHYYNTDQLEEQDELEREKSPIEEAPVEASNSNSYTDQALVQPAPSPLPEPYIINQPTTHNIPPFSFGSKLDLISPKLLHDTVMSPVPQGKKFMCRIVRKNEGMDRRMYPTYELSLEEPVRQQSVFLLRATKKKRSRGSYYAITSDMDNICDYDRKATDDNYGVLGKLRSNFLGTAFNVYSNGRNPFSGTDSGAGQSNNSSPNTSSYGGGAKGEQESDKRKQKKDKDFKNKDLPVRQELGAVIYNPNVLGLKGPRKMTILMNTMTAEGDMVEKRPTQVKDTLIGRLSDGDMTDLLVLKNKSPQWNDDTNSFVLNFGGRVSLASVKNFQIVHDNDLDYIIMQFGRTSQDHFTMDCQYPMTPFQAFAFALTSFDAKLACE